MTTDLVAAAPSEVEITVEYPGYTLVPLSAGAWNDRNDTNWFLAAPIADAYRNGTADKTGFRFVAAPNYALQAFADGGTFGMLTRLLISAAPTVTFVYTDGGSDAFRFDLPGEAGTLKLFSLFELANYRAVTLRDAATGRRRLVFQPVVEVVESGPLPVPTMMQSAFPIGCTISNPAVDV